MSKPKLLHRGAPNNIKAFAPKFVKGRMKGFKKDMLICLTGISSDDREGTTHAYFPALMNCCATLEYLTGLYKGKIKKLGTKDMAEYAEKFLPQPDYDAEKIRVLFDAFRHAVAHRGIASGVWVDNHPETLGRRLTWEISEENIRPALQIKEEASELKRDPPWPCKYTHRVHIYLARLAQDIDKSVDVYLAEFGQSPKLQSNFEKCMNQLYPA